ncbi:MAG: hypothetical protein F6K31_38975 [Symploca sp. SIO2G7]|nr:hypothetical protein [Symploca sp. SIO2G7]
MIVVFPILMYNPNQPLYTATTEDLWTALLLKRRFNNFEPEPIVQDLYAQRQLWQKFWLGWIVFDVDFYQKTNEAPIARWNNRDCCSPITAMG